ncbi:MAG: deoxyguanosinetriphosphate triphosphohydrolase [bacterium]|nr:deoxyguanosinetriphosphate triphosphohydrolase [bacterium]
MNIRTMLEEQEKKILSPKAAFSSLSRGRLHPEEECPIRPSFQRDRDRIIHCKSFRRLKDKTQVFLSPSGDHYRTRLTHTLEVSQIARTIAKALSLNETLTEAISMGHDLGHTPFGHAGEDVLNEIHPGGFKHAEQSLRVADVLEKNGRGLNLTLEVRDGILRHSKGRAELLPTPQDRSLTLEGDIVRVADTIAYVNHDVDDGMRAGIIRVEHLPQDCRAILGETTVERINTMVTDVIKTTLEHDLERICMSEDVLSATLSLREYLYQKVYYNSKADSEFTKASKIIKELYEYYFEHPQLLPDHFTREATSEENIHRAVCDYIAGMTDRFALRLYQEIFFPKPWLVI